MFGYIRPLKGELKVKDYERFKSVYCGLCHSLGKNCGFAARFILNFEFTFLAMLLSECDKPCLEYRRCIASPFRKKCCACGDAAIDTAAYFSMILLHWKLRDTVEDEGFFKALGARLASLGLSRAYKKAAKAEPEFDREVRERLNELGELEKTGCSSLDIPADKFALILASAARSVEDCSRARILELILYHCGRTIYILDAVDDLKDDAANARYNPLALRFELENGALSEADKQRISTTLKHSQNMMISAFELLGQGPYTPIIGNIVYCGMPFVTEKVLAGEWQRREKREKP